MNFDLLQAVGIPRCSFWSPDETGTKNLWGRNLNKVLLSLKKLIFVKRTQFPELKSLSISLYNQGEELTILPLLRYYYWIEKTRVFL